MCFSRVVWGHGPHILYLDSMVELRRLASAFLRRAVASLFDIRLPKEFQPGASTVPPATASSAGNQTLPPLNIVVYSRGSSGKGRSMKGEELLVTALAGRGATAFLCCDFAKVSIDQQLSYAMHADVVSASI